MTPSLTTICKVCQDEAVLHGVVDFNKSCETRNGYFPRLAGVPVWYYRCETCGFLFTRHCDEWSIEDFQTSIYNADYALVDPSQAERVQENITLVALFAREARAERIFDYGGGDGALATGLCKLGFDAESWDPIRNSVPMMERDFEFGCSFEVFEHTPTPRETLRKALEPLQTDAVFVFSTLVLDGHLIPPYSCEHWYIAPRNGHVSIHTRRSLDILFAHEGWLVEHVGQSFHIAQRIPETSA